MALNPRFYGLEFSSQDGDAAQQPLAAGLQRTRLIEGVTERVGNPDAATGEYPDLLWRVTSKTAGITYVGRGRYGFICGKHELARIALTADPVDLKDFRCRVCDAEREATAERARFRELVHAR